MDRVFKEFKKVLDLSSFKIQKTEDSVFKDNWRMLTVTQLQKAIDSLEKNNDAVGKKIMLESKGYLGFIKNLDSNWIPPKTNQHFTSFSQIIPDSSRPAVYDASVSQVNSLKSALEADVSDYNNKKMDLRLHLIEWHRKFSLSLACLVLFLIGAPLGSIIRKGGIGTPLIFAVAFFVVFFLLNNFGEKFVKQDVLEPKIGMWLATFILLPVGVFLVFKAMRDSQLFNQEFYYRFFRKVRKFIKGEKIEKNETGIA